MSHIDRYQKLETLDIGTALIALRAYIGELQDRRSPNQSEVEAVAETLFPNLLVHERAKIIDAFIKSEAEAAAEADKRAE